MKYCILLLLLTIRFSYGFDDWSPYYQIEDIPVPKDVDHQLGGITTLADGRIAACFNSGEVKIYDPSSGQWSPFARGLQSPLGIVQEADGSLVVMHWAELTRLRDTDNDGVADHYQTLSDDFGISGNYHEFAYGPAMDSEGNFYIALNVASNMAGTFKNVRGPWLENGVAREVMQDWRNKERWDEHKKDVGRMYSRVPYRGCVLKVTPDGETSVVAYGFRSPDGIGFDDKGRLWVTDNQGDWRGTSPLYHVKQDHFYGHPASLSWKPDWNRNPLDVPVEELEYLRTPASGLFPHGELANSPTQPIPTISPEKFGLPEGELLIGEMNQPTLIRFLADEVDGFVQGTMIPFLVSTDLGIGNHRLTYSEDGALWIGKTHLKWAGDEGLKKISWTGKPLFLVKKVSLKENGFHVEFSHPINEKELEINISRHTYHYHGEYGSDKVGLKEISVDGIEISEDKLSMFVEVSEIEARYLYTIELGGATDMDGNPLMGNVLRYNVVKEVGFEDLLESNDLSAFYLGKKPVRWSLENGILRRGEEKVGNLSTREKYENFELRFEWKISEGGNSGVIYRTREGRGMEYQVLDDERHIRGKTPNSSAGALYDIVEPKENKIYHPAGEWNHARIIADGNHVEHWLNGEKILEAEIGSDDWQRRFEASKNSKIKGYATGASTIRFQDHGADVSFRNMRIRKL